MLYVPQFSTLTLVKPMTDIAKAFLAQKLLWHEHIRSGSSNITLAFHRDYIYERFTGARN